MTIKDKIKVLKDVKKQISPNNLPLGLCAIIEDCCYLNGFTTYNIELFTFENAIEHGNVNPESDKDYFWWETNINIEDCQEGLKPYKVNDSEIYDYKNRILFVDWMISEYKKML